jgi:hypothetical protein
VTDLAGVATTVVVGAVSGGAVSLVAASRIAEAGERGRQRELARDRIRAAVASAMGRTSTDLRARAAGEFVSHDSLGGDALERFAETICLDIWRLRRRQQQRIWRHIERILGPVDALRAQTYALTPREQRPKDWESHFFWTALGQFDELQVADYGLRGRAVALRASDEDRDALLAEMLALRNEIKP